MKMTGGARQFGIDADQVPGMLRRIDASGLAFEGFHLFAGSQNLRAAAIVEAQALCYDLTLQWQELLPGPLRMLNLGGGFGIPYTITEAPLDLAPVLENLQRLAERAEDGFSRGESGDRTGTLSGGRGRYLRQPGNRSQDIQRPGVSGCRWRHAPAPGGLGQFWPGNAAQLPVAINRRGGEREIASVVGPLCTPLDLLADKMELDVAQPGDLVVVFQSGAYGRTASPRDFLGHPDVIEALV